MLFLKQLSFIVLAVVGAVTANTQCHDENFVPDAVLRITVKNITQSCLPSKSIVLVNGTSPGPELRLLEGKTYWIRVYNDLPEQNLTMVTASSVLLIRCTNFGVALARPLSSRSTFQRRHTRRIAVAYPTTTLLRLRNCCPRRYGRDIFLPLSRWIPSCVRSRPSHHR
jgi:hypothetical protein